MSLCASCGLTLPGDAALCPHHVSDLFDDWAARNRTMCALIHQGVVPPRLEPAEREAIYNEHPEAA